MTGAVLAHQALAPDDLALVRTWQRARAELGSGATAERYGAYVRALARGHPGRGLLELGTEELRTWLAGRSDSRSVATAVRSFYAYAEAVGLLDQSPAAALEHGIPGPAAFAVTGTRTSATDVAGWRKALQGQGAPATTIRTMTYHVQRLARERANRRIRDLTTQELLEWLGEKSWTPGTRKSARSALRSFYGWLADCGTIPQSPADRLPRIRTPRARPKPTPDALYRVALAASDERVRLAVRLAGQCGLRRAEMSRTAREDVVATELGHCLRVVGKGSHVRLVPLPDDLAAQILARPPGWLFPSPYGEGDGHLTPHYLGGLITAALGREATTHTLRHRAATVAYRGTRDLRAVQELLGHSRPETTAGYVAIEDEAIRAAMLEAAR